MNYLDKDGYPEEEALKIIREWTDPWPSLMNFVKNIWWMPDWGWNEQSPRKDILDREITEYLISTGGWSGNEELIGALQSNKPFWMLCWHSSRVGGHFVFHVRL